MEIQRRFLISWRRYEEWLAKKQPTAAELARQASVAASWDDPPRISFLTPVWNVAPSVLEATIQSVRAQSAPHWELCLADGCSKDQRLRDIMARHAAEDRRIKTVFLPENLGISGNSNAALALATGDYVAILDHDDVIAPDFVFLVAERIVADRSLDIVYVDEDKVSADGTRHLEPWFKPGWSPETLLCANYLMHSVFRARLVRDLGGFDPATDGSQDWDLAFRLTERTDAVAHVPRVLYHWRMVPASTASSGAAKPKVYLSQEAAIRRHLERLGVPEPKVDAHHPGLIRSTWTTPPANVLVVVWGSSPPARLAACLRALCKTTRHPRWRALVPATPGDPRWQAALAVGDPRVQPTSAVPWDAARTQADGMVALLADDLLVQDADWLEELERWTRRPGAAAVAGAVHYPDGNIVATGRVLGPTGSAVPLFEGMQDHFSLFGSTTWYRRHLVVAPDLVAIPATALAAQGTPASADLDEMLAVFCLRARQAGQHAMFTPCAKAVRPGQPRPFDGGLFHEAARADRSLVPAADPYANPALAWFLSEPMLPRLK
ncbi:MAG: hypothetical protein QOD77_33 [Thermoplasmata archaeon]|nr:hypothetical protein [Thermoplasmata archaeon]